MKAFKSVLSGLALVMACSAAHAYMINVAGVTWDPDEVSLTDSDFTARYSSNQFFTHGADAVANTVNAAPDYSKAIDPTTVGVGDVLQGVGEVTKFNGVDYGDTTSTVGGAFCPSCELTFAFGGFVVNTNGFSNGWLRLYVDNTPDFNISSSPAANATDGTLFLELTAKSSAFMGATDFSSGYLSSYFDVTGGVAASNFDTNTERFATDLWASASQQFSNHNFIATATGQIAGDSVPEPSTVFLMGLAMLGLAFVRRKTKS